MLHNLIDEYAAKLAATTRSAPRMEPTGVIQAYRSVISTSRPSANEVENELQLLYPTYNMGRLPFVIIAFQAIEQHFPPQTAGRIPLLSVGVLAAGYSLIRIKQKAAVQCIPILAAGALIFLGIVKFEDNANKYIHIPEYIVMTWLIYLALIVDYNGFWLSTAAL